MHRAGHSNNEFQDDDFFVKMAILEKWVGLKDKDDGILSWLRRSTMSTRLHQILDGSKLLLLTPKHCLYNSYHSVVKVCVASFGQIRTGKPSI